MHPESLAEILQRWFSKDVRAASVAARRYVERYHNWRLAAAGLHRHFWRKHRNSPSELVPPLGNEPCIHRVMNRERCRLARIGEPCGEKPPASPPICQLVLNSVRVPQGLLLRRSRTLARRAASPVGPTLAS